MKLNWELATKEEIWNIIGHDWNIPKHLLEGLVIEGLRRRLFKPLIKHLIYKTFDYWGNRDLYDLQDLYAMGEAAIFIAMKNYKPGKSSFKTFAYRNIKSEFTHYQDRINTQKRKIYKDIISLDVEKFDDNEETFVSNIIDESSNPEEIVLKKLFWEETFAPLTEREVDALVSFAQGYTMRETSNKYGFSSVTSINRAFHRGLLKINPDRKHVSLGDLGIISRSKGA